MGEEIQFFHTIGIMNGMLEGPALNLFHPPVCSSLGVFTSFGSLRRSLDGEEGEAPP